MMKFRKRWVELPASCIHVPSPAVSSCVYNRAVAPSPGAGTQWWLGTQPSGGDISRRGVSVP